METPPLWEIWVKSELYWDTNDLEEEEKESRIPRTRGFFLLPLLSTLVLPTIQQITVSYAMRNLASLGTIYVKNTLNNLISMPVNFVFKTNTTASNADIDSAIESHMNKGEKIQKDLFNHITNSNRSLMLLFVSILSLYFQYLGMTIMKEENAKYKDITALIDDADMDKNKSAKGNASVNSRVKQIIHYKYNTATYYKTPAEGVIHQNLFNIQEYDPVRMVYNTLVGLNHTLFVCIGGQSDDPTHEITHWTKVLFYWEILARLLNQHGLGPLKLASSLFLHDLWKQNSGA